MSPLWQDGHGFAIGQEIVFDVLNGRLVQMGREDPQVQLKPVTVRLLWQFADTPRTVVWRRQLLNQNWRAYAMEVAKAV